MKKYAFILPFIVLLATSCKKEEELNPVPQIEFVSISETTVEQFENNIAITISYADENGDIGYQDPDTYSLRVKDARLSEFDWYHIPPLTPNEEELNISGDFQLELNTLFLLGNASEESTSFSIQLKDREGNWSNTIQSPQILIVDSL